jgi:hypothetical protein
MTANDLITKQDLLEVKRELLEEIKKLIMYRKQEAVYYKSKEVRELLKCSDSTLQYYRQSGKLSTKKVGGTYYYTQEDVDNLLASEN